MIRDLERAGFELQSVRGSHRKYMRGGAVVIISGSAGDDVKRYQEKAVKDAIQDEEA
ncbi:type II toxin-antitoxin system HicA family toxin [Deinococcus radiopugnans]|uniref:type II toxin-antitoxin system HicA family toxin n=1 Tax=Deinococcus radiopugnans TaxID=57497 RepID=UPI001C3F9EC3|nr:type II toxin-antitoxin system HicA family toxin [Deinococcus radiopugnans]